MAAFTVAAIQAAYVLMDREATLERVAALTAEAAANGAKLVVFPEAFVPGDPSWKDAGIIWDGDEAWYSMLVDQSIVVPSEATDRLRRDRPRPRTSRWSSASTSATARRHPLLHAALLRAGRAPARQAPQAEADRLGTRSGAGATAARCPSSTPRSAESAG